MWKQKMHKSFGILAQNGTITFVFSNSLTEARQMQDVLITSV